MDDARTRTTDLVLSSPAPGSEAFASLVGVVYEELKRLAGALLRRERPGHTLQPTALVHEAYLHLVDSTRLQWKDRVHFLAIAARAMRQVLVHHARARGAAKRGGGRDRITLHDAPGEAGLPGVEVLALEEALEELARLDERKARVVELRFFSGLTLPEAAAVLGVSISTAEDDWALARAWLGRRLS
jgi:RNA polymerase sigma factor (TIGR02999 family)